MVVIPNRVRVLVVVSALALAAGLLTLALLAKPTQAQAQHETFRAQMPFEMGGFNPCTGETYYLEGTVHLVTQVTQDANGNFHFTSHQVVEGQGVGASGAKYVVHDSFNTTINFTLEAAQTFTQEFIFKVIRQGSDTPEDDYTVKYLIHFTVTANGELTSEVGRFEIECN